MSGIESAKVLVRLTRLDSSMLAFAAVFIPQCAVGGDLAASASLSLPALTISMCGFVLNDLEDVNKDSRIHPSRPLPHHDIEEKAAAFIYFSLLGVSLVLLRLFVGIPALYAYITFLTAMVNYNYFVRHYAPLKNLYVATIATMPIGILDSLLGFRWEHAVVAVALFFSIMGREILMDVLDLPGDRGTLVARLGPPTSERLAFASMMIGALVLSAQIRGVASGIAVLAYFLLYCFAAYLWRSVRLQIAIVRLLKLQLGVGILFLL